MSWRRLNDDEPELYFATTATDDVDLAKDLATVVRRMVTNRLADGVHRDIRALHFYTNATNGYVRIYWRDAEGRSVGQWFYTLLAQDLWQVAIDHADGAFHFDGVINMALTELVECEEDIFGDTAELLDVFTQTELRPAEQFFL